MELRGCRRAKKPIFGFFSRHYYTVRYSAMQTKPKKGMKKETVIFSLAKCKATLTQNVKRAILQL